MKETAGLVDVIFGEEVASRNRTKLQLSSDVGGSEHGVNVGPCKSKALPSDFSVTHSEDQCD